MPAARRHVALVAFTGFRVREQAMLELGMKLPGLQARAEAIGRLPALGLLTIAAHTPGSWTCSYHDAPPGGEGRLLHELLEARPDLVAVSALTASIEPACRFSDALRCAGIPVVIGGLHATAAPATIADHFTSVIVGDGEDVWPELLSDCEAGCLMPIYRGFAPIDLRDSRVPRFDLLGDGGVARMTLQTQRGCPFACEFCGASRLLGRFREKPIENIRRELAAMGERETNPVIELADDNTFAGKREVEPLFEAFAAAGVRYFTESDWRIGERPEVLAGLAASGCVQVLVGMESLAAQPRGMGAKTAELTRVEDAIRAIQESGVCVIGCFILGCDGETEESIDRLIKHLDDSPLADVQITLQTPFPGTGLHSRLARQGRLLPDRSWSSYTLFDVTYQPDCMTVEALEAGFIRAVQATFAEGPTRRRERLRREIWSSRRRFACQ